jgi:hypothetical protein
MGIRRFALLLATLGVFLHPGLAAAREKSAHTPGIPGSTQFSKETSCEFEN